MCALRGRTLCALRRIITVRATHITIQLQYGPVKVQCASNQHFRFWFCGLLCTGARGHAAGALRSRLAALPRAPEDTHTRGGAVNGIVGRHHAVVKSSKSISASLLRSWVIVVGSRSSRERPFWT